MLLPSPEGNYRFLPSSGEAGLPFCNAVIADPGYEIVRATLESPVPYRAGFELIEQHLKALGRPRQALCGVELRCAEPYSPEGFRAFNATYAELLGTRGLHGGTPGSGRTARTNVAPALYPPAEQVLHGELHDELNAAGFVLAAGEMGENITTRGVDLLGLPAGARLHIGAAAVVEVTGLRNPCVQLDRLRPGLMAATLGRDEQGALIRKAGVMGVVLTDGEVCPGDAVRVELPPEPHRPLETV